MVKGSERAGATRLRPLPFITFAEFQAAGFEIEVHCPSCHRWKPPALEGRGHRCFAGVRFRCRECVARGLGGSGHLAIRSPIRRLAPPPDYVVADLSCGSCVPYWEICDIDPRQPPWLLEDGQRFACPGCRRRLRPGSYHRLPGADGGDWSFAAHLLDPRGERMRR